MTLSVSPALEGDLSRLVVASGSTEADVLLKAIVLHDVALQAKLRDQSVVIADASQCVVSEIIEL